MTPVPPQFCPSPRELDDLELLLTGALAPVSGFNEPGSVVTLRLPRDPGEPAEPAELVDPEGVPLARITPAGNGGWRVTPLARTRYGPFRGRYLTPEQTRERHAGATFVPVTSALTSGQLAQLSDRGRVVLLALAGHGTPEGLSGAGLIRAALAAAALLPDAEVVAVALAAHGDPEADQALSVRVAASYAGADPVLTLAGDDSDLPGEVATAVEFDRPAPGRQGVVVFFTGLSGSGKSTLARALTDHLLEQGLRTVTSLDGDVVRRQLSAGLSFTKADRETNIRRIGWVAAEVSRHGGVAVCSPIAPFAETRAQVRDLAEDAGAAFILIHVATPLAECERRDRKGLYARARRGEIPDFTGISSPYEEPADPALRLDTTGRALDDCLNDVLGVLAASGHLSLSEAVDPITTQES
jgi:sulfate adenylyltransferase